MAKYQGFVLIAGKLRNAEEAEEFFRILKHYAKSIQYCRSYFPVIRVRRRNGYEIEVFHLGCCSGRHRKRLAALEARLRKRFRNAGIRPLCIEELKEI